VHGVIRGVEGRLMGFRVPQPPPAPARTPAGTDAGPVGLSVNRIACDGYGSCAELLPEMIALDEWGYPVLRPGPVPPQLLGHARMAVDTCPVLALRLVRLERATMGPGGRR
jgi:ferredoxin